VTTMSTTTTVAAMNAISTTAVSLRRQDHGKG
jgi:hypothetical protein